MSNGRFMPASSSRPGSSARPQRTITSFLCMANSLSLLEANPESIPTHPARRARLPRGRGGQGGGNSSEPSRRWFREQNFRVAGQPHVFDQQVIYGPVSVLLGQLHGIDVLEQQVAAMVAPRQILRLHQRKQAGVPSVVSGDARIGDGGCRIGTVHPPHTPAPHPRHPPPPSTLPPHP